MADFFQIAYLLGAAQGVFLAAILLSRTRSVLPNRLLAAVMLVFSIDLAMAWYHTSGAERAFPHLIGLDLPVAFLYGPLLYLYAATLTREERQLRAVQWLHFVPFILLVVYLAPFYASSGPHKLAVLQEAVQDARIDVATLLGPLKLVHGFVKSMRQSGDELAQRLDLKVPQTPLAQVAQPNPLGAGGALRVLGVELAVLAVLLDLLPDRVELAVDHRLGHVEAVAVGQLVEQLAFGALPGQALVVLADLVAHPLLQAVQVLFAELLGELVVDLDRLGLPQFLHLDVELRGLTRQLAVHVAVREGDLDGLFLARLDADQLVLEALDEAVGTEFQVMVLGLHARVLLAVDLAREVDHQDVALLGRTRRLDRLALLLLGSQPLQRLVDLVVGDLDLVGGHRDLAEVHRLDVRQQLQLHPVDQILPLVEGLHRDVRLAGGAQAALLDHLLRGVADGALQHLAHHGLAEALLEDAHRRLARPEARDLLVLADLAQPALNLLVDLVGFQGDHELALEAFVLFLGDLHGPLGPFLMRGAR